MSVLVFPAHAGVERAHSFPTCVRAVMSPQAWGWCGAGLLSPQARGWCVVDAFLVGPIFPADAGVQRTDRNAAEALINSPSRSWESNRKE